MALVKWKPVCFPKHPWASKKVLEYLDSYHICTSSMLHKFLLYLPCVHCKTAFFNIVFEVIDKINYTFSLKYDIIFYKCNYVMIIDYISCCFYSSLEVSNRARMNGESEREAEKTNYSI